MHAHACMLMAMTRCGRSGQRRARGSPGRAPARSGCAPCLSSSVALPVPWGFPGASRPAPGRAKRLHSTAVDQPCARACPGMRAHYRAVAQWTCGLQMSKHSFPLLILPNPALRSLTASTWCGVAAISFMLMHACMHANACCKSEPPRAAGPCSHYAPPSVQTLAAAGARRCVRACAYV